jgi:hypothetical protein
VWTKRPAGPVIVALGMLAATLLAGGADLALDTAREAEQAADRQALGEEMARVRTPAGYTVAEDSLRSLQASIGEAQPERTPTDERLPLYLDRDATLTSGDVTRSGWRVLGLPEETIRALGLPVPEEGSALADPGDRQLADRATVRVQKAPEEEVKVREGFQGQLARTVRVADTYQHSEDDEYEFQSNVTPGAKRLVAFVVSDGNDTDFDLEVESPSGSTWLDDNGSIDAPEQPRVEISEPEGGRWTYQVHAKAARNDAFRLRVFEVFDARDAEALGRLLEGEGFRAVGAQLGLTSQARLDLNMQRADLSTLGPDRGLLVLRLDRLQAPLNLQDEATGLLVRPAPGENPLEGLEASSIRTLETQLEQARQQADTEADPVRGLVLTTSANDRAESRAERLASTNELMGVVLPAGVLAGILLSTWAAGLHARRMRREITVLAGFGHSRARNLGLVAAHLGPAILLGVGLALAASPFVGQAIAGGLGLSAAGAAFPDASTLLAPGLALIPIAATVLVTLREPLRGVDPGHQGVPSPPRKRWGLAGGLLALAAIAALLAFALANPSTSYLAAASAGALAGASLIVAPIPEIVLSRARSLRASLLGLFRTRSMHAPLALASAAMALVLAALFAGVTLSQAAEPDPVAESGGYDVIATTPSFTQSYAEVLPGGDQRSQAEDLLSRTISADFLMRVTGTGIHSAETDSEQTVYGIDSSFAQRHRHDVRPLGPADPFLTVAGSQDKAVVSTRVHEALDDRSTIEVRGPGGVQRYDVVGVVETRLLDGVYISKAALPPSFSQIAGEQRLRVPDDPDAYAQSLQSAFREEALTARSAQALVGQQLDGQQRAGATLTAMAGLGVATAIGFVVLIGIRARAERRLSDTVLSALGARPGSLAAGLATETAIPVVVGFAAGTLAAVPMASQLANLSGLAFPLTPIDTTNLWGTAGIVLAILTGLVLGVSATIAWRARGELDRATIRDEA